MEYTHFSFAAPMPEHHWKAWEQIALFAGVFVVAAVVWYGE